MTKLVFKRKANWTLWNIIPHKAIVTKTKEGLKEGEIQQHILEWIDYLKNAAFNDKKLVTVTIEWDSPVVNKELENGL
jgi:hypothetical protein